MIVLLRGPGGALHRLIAELVPLGVGIAVAGCALALLGVAAAAGLGLAAWVGVSALLRAVRRRPVLRRLYRLAVFAHVAFWTVMGLRATVPGEAGPPALTGSHAWQRPTTFRAGYADFPFDLPPHATLAGWGTRPRRAAFPPFAGLGVLGRLGLDYMGARHGDGPARRPLFHLPDPTVTAERLGARAIVLRPDAEGAAPLAVVRLDLVTCDADLAREIRAGVSDLGYRPETVVVAATHTHSGPGGYSRQAFSAVAGTDHFDPAVFRAVRNAAIGAVRAAHREARPARIALLRSYDRGAGGQSVLARSRRREAPGAIDDRVYGLRLEDRTDGTPIAFVLNYGVHPTLLRRRHMGFHRDLAGALEDALALRLGGRAPVLFLNGATAEATARAAPGTPARRAALLAERFSDAIAADFFASGDGAERLRLRAARVTRQLADPTLVVASGDRAGFLDDQAGPLWSGGLDALAAKAVALPVNVFLWSLWMPELRVGFRWDGSVGAVVNLADFVERRRFDVGAVTFEAGAGERWVLLWTPGEATRALGRLWRAQAAARGFRDALLVGFAGGSTAYLTSAQEYREDTYEARGTLFGAEAGAQVGTALELALDAAIAAPP